jgi:peptidoglycan/xylan/chitin deacetylase (PgdA/CDA1 family)
MEPHLQPHEIVAREIGTQGLGAQVIRARELSRREALELSALGVLGVGLSSGFLAGDSEPTPTRQPVRQPVRTLAKGPPPTHRSAPAHPASATRAVAVWKKPARSVHDLKPDAPKNAIALTIDDGPHPKWTPLVLDLLAKHEVQATFCLIGEQVRDNYKVVQLMVEAGHQVANHTWRHPIDINRFSNKRVETEITKTHRVIVEVTGTAPRLFRAPGGNWSPTVFKAVARHGMFPIDWDIDPRDWSRPGVSHVTRKLLEGRAGDILLCHDGGGDRSQTLKSLKTVLPRLKSRGLEFITL